MFVAVLRGVQEDAHRIAGHILVGLDDALLESPSQEEGMLMLVRGGRQLDNEQNSLELLVLAGGEEAISLLLESAVLWLSEHFSDRESK